MTEKTSIYAGAKNVHSIQMFSMSEIEESYACTKAVEEINIFQNNWTVERINKKKGFYGVHLIGKCRNLINIAETKKLLYSQLHCSALKV